MITLEKEKFHQKAMNQLEEVIDPELQVDIVNLGLIYNVDVDEVEHDGLIIVTMTLTSMGCPLAGEIQANIKEKLLLLPEIEQVEVELVWSPAWTKDRMSRYAKIALGIT